MELNAGEDLKFICSVSNINGLNGISKNGLCFESNGMHSAKNSIESKDLGSSCSIGNNFSGQNGDNRNIFDNFQTGKDCEKIEISSSLVPDGSCNVINILPSDEIKKEIFDETPESFNLSCGFYSNSADIIEDPNFIDPIMGASNIQFNPKHPKKSRKVKEIDSIAQKELINQVLANSDGELSIPCAECGRNFTSLRSLKIHISTLHKRTGQFACEYCNKTFSRMGNLKTHVANVHEKKETLDEFGNPVPPPKKIKIEVKEEDKLRCDECGRTFDDLRSLKIHVAYSHKKLEEYHCDQCNKSYTRLGHLKTHIENVHVAENPDDLSKKFCEFKDYTVRVTVFPEEPIACHICGAKFTAQQSLQTHVTVIHEGKRPHFCDRCGRNFASAGYLRQHISTVHEKQRPYICDQCGACFSQGGNLKNHVRTVHEGLKPLKCNFCDQTFSAQSNLASHIGYIHGTERPFICDICGTSFVFAADRKKHIEAVHEKKKPFNCPECKKSFSKQTHLNTHLEGVHMKIRYSCDICGGEFSAPWYVDKHKAIVHEGNREFTCDYCGGSFSLLRLLKRHISETHGENLSEQFFKENPELLLKSFEPENENSPEFNFGINAHKDRNLESKNETENSEHKDCSELNCTTRPNSDSEFEGTKDSVIENKDKGEIL